MKAFLKTAMAMTALGAGLALAAPAMAQDTINLPNLTYRTGPFATSGIPLANGQIDYLNMLNERDGGLNGVKLNGEECETGYNTEKGVECYEKTKGSALVTQPWSTGITLQVLPKASVDKRSIFAAGYGFSAMQDGKTFPWAFNPPSSYWDGASILLQAISDGNLDNLKGKKIVLLHLDAPYGKEPILFDIPLSFRVLFIAIIGGLGSILGNYLGAILIVALPVILNTLPATFGLPVSSSMVEHLNIMVVGATIIFFLIIEPHGLARFWQIIREKLIMWPFPH